MAAVRQDPVMHNVTHNVMVISWEVYEWLCLGFIFPLATVNTRIIISSTCTLTHIQVNYFIKHIQSISNPFNFVVWTVWFCMWFHSFFFLIGICLNNQIEFHMHFCGTYVTSYKVCNVLLSGTLLFRPLFSHCSMVKHAHKQMNS